MKWFRFYTEVLDDPKVQRLSPHLFKAWVNLLCIASKGDGKLPSYDDLAFMLRMSVQDVASHVDDLILAGLIDLDGKGGRRPHNWEVRQYVSDTSAARVRKHRDKKKKGTMNGDVTPDVTLHVTPSDTDSETQTDKETPPIESENKSLPPEQEATRESENFIFDLSRVGLGGAGGEPSPAAKREAARLLNVADVEPLVDRYRRWSKSKTARDPDALFVASAPKLFKNAPEAVRAACKPIEQPIPAPSRPLVASAQLAAMFAGGRR